MGGHVFGHGGHPLLGAPPFTITNGDHLRVQNDVLDELGG